MAEAERPREIQVGIPPSQPPPPALAANICLVNHVGQLFVLDFGFLDPLVLATQLPEQQTPIHAAHIGRIVIARDIAIQLRDQLNRALGET